MPSLPITATVPWIQYTATPAQTVFVVPYIFFATTDLQVYYSPVGTTPSDITNLLVINVGYTVTLNVNTYTGSITLTVPANAGDLITIVRNMPNTRTNYYIQGGAITPDTLNTNDSSEVLMTQQNNYVINNRNPRYQFTNNPLYPNDILLPILGANQIWVKDPTNTFIEAAAVPAGSIDLPTVTNTLALFTDTTGTLESLAPAVPSATLVSTNASVPVWSASMTNGQIIIGSTGATPLAASLTAGVGVVITPGAGSITISSTGGGGFATVIQNTNAVTMAKSTQYVMTNGAVQVVLTLPAVAAVGDTYRIIGTAGSTGGWQVAEAAGQTIHFGTSTCTTTTGTLTSTNANNQITIVCTTANTTFECYGAQGNITVV